MSRRLSGRAALEERHSPNWHRWTVTYASAGELLTAVMADLGQRVLDRRPAALEDEPDAVHQLRTAVRRLRNVLAAFRKYLDPDATSALRACLKTYGDLLGECRDLEVRAQHCAASIAELELDAELQEELVVPLVAAHRAAHGVLVAWHNGPDRAALDALLGSWSTAPPVTDRAGKGAEEVATTVVRKQVDRVLRLAHELDDVDGEEAHEVRKAARRLRHTADAVTTAPAKVLGDWASAVGNLGQRVQHMLGDHRDAMLLAEHVRDHATRAADPTPYLRLVAHAEHQAGAAVGGLAQALLELRDARKP